MSQRLFRVLVSLVVLGRIAFCCWQQCLVADGKMATEGQQNKKHIRRLVREEEQDSTPRASKMPGQLAGVTGPGCDGLIQ
jgi:hypothetical protein